MKTTLQLSRLIILLLLITIFSCADEELTQNTAPVIEDQTFTIQENSADHTAVGTVLATDADTDQTLVYSFVSGNTGDAFSIDPNTGVITVNNVAVLNYEATEMFTLVIEVTDGEAFVSATITIMLTDVIDEAYENRDQLLAGLAEVYTDLRGYIEYSFLFDAVYSNTTTAPNTAWEAIYDHNQNPTNAKVNDMWYKGWNLVLRTNNVINSAEFVITNSDERVLLTAQAKMIRAYVFFSMFNWFGPIQLETHTLDTGLPKNTQQEVFDFLKTDLQACIDALPFSSNDGSFTKHAAWALLAQVYLYEGTFQKVLEQTEYIINSAEFLLQENPDTFSSATGEIIWGFDRSSDAEFSAFFTKGAYVPVLRLTEIYLINAEANLWLGNDANAVTALNILRERRSQEPVSSEETSDVIRVAIYDQWATELAMEGRSFFKMRRSGEVVSVLDLEEYKMILPIPQTAIEGNSNLAQNTGY